MIFIFLLTYRGEFESQDSVGRFDCHARANYSHFCHWEFMIFVSYLYIGVSLSPFEKRVEQVQLKWQVSLLGGDKLLFDLKANLL